MINEQFALDQAIVGILIESLPESWRAADLHVAFATDAMATSRIICPDSAETHLATADLTDAIARLQEYRDTSNLPWKAAVYNVRANELGQWEVSAEFE